MAGLWVMLSGAVLLAVNAYVITRIARRLAPNSRFLPIVAGLAASLYYGLNSWTLAGMETGLVALLCSLAVLAVLRSCAPLTGTCRPVGACRSRPASFSHWEYSPETT